MDDANDSFLEMGSGVGAFSNTVIELPSGTVLHVRAYASNATETVYGKDKVFTANDGDFKTKVSNGILSVDYKGIVSEWWTLELAAPSNGKLIPGNYDKAERSPFNEKTRPGMSFTGSGRGCNKIAGSFNIEKIIYSADGSTILYLDATFVQHCEETKPPLMGRVHYDVRP